ncbi:enoyl-CoA hydratase-related protein [Afifella pfennigii]|uniref:enoyl-CoA hydratase-related protein n=1 Tax=Afifella pfennigii TaxID=209897 RepID=UPI0005572538|nr:enoyl-CoA hydratase-related protein [Afifella pfennigii]
MNEAQSVIVETPSEAVRLVRMYRPQARNALNLVVRRGLMQALAEASEACEVRAVILTGDDKAFAAGADIGEMKDASPPDIHARRIEAFWESVGGFQKPLIAAVNGYALGAGCELALACDIVVAGRGACFGLPEVRLGIMPGGGGSQRLARIAGKHVALRYMLTGERFEAEAAWRHGLVTDLTADEETLPTALAIAEKIAAMPPLAVAKIKESVVKGLNAPLDAALALERQSYYFLNATADKEEGVAAFLEKRPGRFSGK